MLIVKDHGGLESVIGAHFESNSWLFENMKIFSGNGPAGTFSSVATYNIDFGTRKKTMETSKFQNCSKCIGKVSNRTKSTFLNNFFFKALFQFLYSLSIL